MPAQLMKSHPMKRGRPKKVKRASTAGRKSIFIMNQQSFVPIPKECKIWIYEQYASGKLEKPQPDTVLEGIFYRSLAQKEIITTDTWMGFLRAEGGKLLQSDPKSALELLGLFPDEMHIANALSTFELQRWYEMYYVSMIQKYGKCSTEFYPCYDSGVVTQIAAKYGLVDAPCESTILLPLEGGAFEPSSMFSPKQTKAKKKMGRLLGGGTKIDYAGVEKLRISLMKCKSPDVIAKELDTSNQTVYASMKINMFAGKHELNKTINFHVETLKRLIPKGDVTFEKYVKTYAICETALIKALYKSDPTFVYNWKIIPTEPSFEYEYVKHKSSKLKLSQAFGVPETLVSKWLEKYAMGKVAPPKAQTKSATAKSIRKGSDLTYDEHLVRLGIDPGYDPLAAEREKWNRDYQIG
jgi:hypothetical protein